MTISIGPPAWQQQYQDWPANPGQEVGAFFNSLADVIGATYGYPGVISPPIIARPSSGAGYPAPAYRPAPPPYYPMPPQGMPQYMGPGIPSARIMPTIPGAPAIGVKLLPLGFSAVLFSATSGTALSASTRPQKPFKGRRLVVELARTGTTATGLVTVTSITVGVNNQLVSTGAVSAGAFAAGAFDVNIEMSACSSALDIAVNYAINTAPTTTDTVAVGTTLFGETVGS